MSHLQNCEPQRKPAEQDGALRSDFLKRPDLASRAFDRLFALARAENIR